MRTSIVALVLVLFTGILQAHDEKDCAKDIETYCKGMTGNKLTNCLKKNKEKLSSDCKKSVSDHDHKEK